MGQHNGPFRTPEDLELKYNQYAYLGQLRAVETSIKFWQIVSFSFQVRSIIIMFIIIIILMNFYSKNKTNMATIIWYKAGSHQNNGFGEGGSF